MPTLSASILPVLVACSCACLHSAGFSKEADFLTQVHALTEQRGVTFRREYTGEGFSNLSGGIQRGATYEGLVKLGLQIDLQCLFNPGAFRHLPNAVAAGVRFDLTF